MLVHLQVLAVLCHRAQEQGLGPGEQEPGGEAQARVHQGEDSEEIVVTLISSYQVD